VRVGLAHRWVQWMPWVFVLIWSTGFVVARFGMPHAPPMSFLSLRFALSVACLAGWVVLSNARWPNSPRQFMHLAVSGVLMHAGYLGGVWSAVKIGIGAGTVSLLVGLQPVLTAIWLATAGSRAVHGRVGAREWWGLGLGLVGLALVLSGKFGIGEVTPWNLALAVLALLSITTGTLYQKHFVEPCDVRTASAVQLLAALAVSLPFALLEAEPIAWHPQLIGALVWSVLVLTLGGSSLLYLLIQRGAATRVTSLLYLVPPCTALLAWLLFGESFTLLMLLGLLLTVAGVAMVVKAPQASPQ
jgi:drug/metabolite transporter (DMT)-like permease